MEAAHKSHDRSQYQGCRLLYLLLALLVPAGFLYLRIVLGLAATDSRIGAATATWLARWSLVSLIAYFVTQALSTVYLGRLLPSTRTRPGKIAQYCAVLVACVLFSLTAAISLEAFGFDVFLRAAGK